MFGLLFIWWYDDMSFGLDSQIVAFFEAGASKNIADKHGLTPLEPCFVAAVSLDFIFASSKCLFEEVSASSVKDTCQNFPTCFTEELAQRRNKVSIWDEKARSAEGKLWGMISIFEPLLKLYYAIVAFGGKCRVLSSVVALDLCITAPLKALVVWFIHAVAIQLFRSQNSFSWPWSN